VWVNLFDEREWQMKKKKKNKEKKKNQPASL